MANAAKITERGSDGIAMEALTPASQPGDVFPAGAMLHYAGSAAPTGWLICDGTAVSRATYPQLFANIGTTYGAGDGSTTFNLPDTRGRSPVGKHSSGTFVTLGATGGEENHTLTAAEMPAHTHVFTGSALGTHTHTFSGSALGGHSHSVGPNTTDPAGAHNHSVAPALTTALGSGSTIPEGGSIGSGHNLSGVVTGTAADHTHTFSGNTNTVSAGTPAGTNSATSAGTPSGTNANSGGGGTHNNMQPYMVLNHIIRAY